MNTDEYQISLAREIMVCKNVIARINRELARLEKKYATFTAAFAAGHSETVAPDNPDRHHWQEEYEALRTWQQRLREYEEALGTVRQW